MVPFVAKILEACSESKVGCLVFVWLFDSPFSTNMANLPIYDTFNNPVQCVMVKFL